MPVTSTFDVSDLTPQQINAIVAAAVGVGTLYCFLGYRTLRFVLGLTGFLIAGGVAATLVNWVTQGNQLAALIGLFLGGMCGAFALFFLYRAGVFILGMLGAALIAHNFLDARPETWIPLVVVGVAIVGGLIALLLERPVVLLATAAIGAWIVVSGVAYFMLGSTEVQDLSEIFESEDQRIIVMASWTVLTIGGVLSQIATTGKKAKD